MPNIRGKHFMEQIREMKLAREREQAAERVRPAAPLPPKRRQRKLFSGMDCLAGQQDLFETDGAPDPDGD